MRHEILYKPSYAMIRFDLEPGEQIMTEAGSMVSMSGNMGIETLLNANYDKNAGFFARMWRGLVGLVIAILRKFLGGESVFVNIYEPKDGGGELVLAPGMVGDIVHHRLENQTLYVQASSYLASSPELQMKMKFGGLKSFIMGEGLVLLEISGTGDLWINSYGGIEELEVDGSFIVDTGHMVAFEPSLNYTVKKVGRWKSTVLSGEGIVAEYTGTGKLWIQTRSLDSLVGWVSPMFY